jgi:hypothetical protein
MYEITSDLPDPGYPGNPASCAICKCGVCVTHPGRVKRAIIFSLTARVSVVRAEPHLQTSA